MSGSSDTYLDASLATDGSPDSNMAAYTRLVGRRLRTVREERLYSLRDVERESGSEFSSSVVGAYERGERMMSVQRLDRLAQFYNVPIAHLLPSSGVVADDEPRPLRLRLDRLAELEGGAFDGVRELVADVQRQRGEDPGDLLTLRDSDLRAIASLFAVPTDEMADRLTLLDLLG